MSVSIVRNEFRGVNAVCGGEISRCLLSQMGRRWRHRAVVDAMGGAAGEFVIEAGMGS
jgi:hypothetical protein